MSEDKVVARTLEEISKILEGFRMRDYQDVPVSAFQEAIDTRIKELNQKCSWRLP